MEKVAVLLTVYNRRDVTLKGLHSLYVAIDKLGDGFLYDVYMTDDGSTDGTADAVGREFPNIHIIQGDGNLYWSGGMRRAWQAAIDSRIDYDFYLWFNDDVELYDDALMNMFEACKEFGDACLITGAICDHKGNPSYGGKMEEGKVLEPNGLYQEVNLMNGNLVLIPNQIYLKLGMIDKVFTHSFGDYDYGLRAMKSNIKVKLTAKYVGLCDRHDELIPRYYSKNLSLLERINLSYSPRYSINSYFIFILRYQGLMQAIKYFLARNFYTLFPQMLRWKE